MANGADLKRENLSLRLAAQSAYKLGEDGVLAALLGIEAFRTSETMAARRNLFRLQKEAGYPVHFLAGHGSAVKGVAFSPDGKLMASVGCKERNAEGDCTLGEIVVWDAVKETRLRELTGHGGAALCVTFSPDGKLMATGGDDGTILLWEVMAVLVSGQTPPTELKGHPGGVRALAFSPDGKLLASAGGGEKIVLWDVAGKNAVGEFRSQAPQIACVEFSPDGKTLASGGWDIAVKLWDVAAAPKPSDEVGPSANEGADGSGDDSREDDTKKVPVGLRGVLNGHTGVVLGIAYSPDGKTLASGSWDHTVRLWDVSEMTAGHGVFPCRAILMGHADAVASVVFYREGTRVASGSWDGQIRLWNAETGERMGQLNRPHGAVESIAFNNEGETLAAACSDGTIGLWKIRPQAIATLGEVNNYFALRFSPVNGLLAAGNAEGNIFLWETSGRQNAGAPMATLEGHLAQIQCVAFHPDGTLLASGGWDGMLRLWDVGKVMETPGAILNAVAMVAGIASIVWSAAFSPDGKTIITGDDSGMLRVWDVATLLKAGVPEDFDIDVLSQEPQGQVHAHSNVVEGIAFSPNGRTVVSAGADEKIFVWDVATLMNAGATLKPIDELKGLDGVVHAVAFSPDGTMIAACGNDRPIVLWDATSREELFRLNGHTNGVSCLAFSPDSRMLASGGFATTLGGTDTTVRLWDLQSEQPMGGFEEHPSDVMGVAFRRDGNVLASSGFGSEIFLWDMDARSWSETLCKCVDRNLTRREYTRYIDSDAAAYDAIYAKEPTCRDLPVEK